MTKHFYWVIVFALLLGFPVGIGHCQTPGGADMPERVYSPDVQTLPGNIFEKVKEDPDAKPLPGNIFEKTDPDAFPQKGPSAYPLSMETLNIPPAIWEKLNQMRGEKDMIISMDKAIEIALNQNPSLKAEETGIQTAVGKYYEARAGKNIKLDLKGSYTRLDPVATMDLGKMFPGAPSIKTSDENNFSGKVVFEKVLTTFGKLENAILASYINIQVSRERYEVEKQKLIFNVKQAYLQTLKAKGYLVVAEYYLESSKDQLKLSQDMFEAGVLSRYEVLRAQLQVSKAEQQLVQTRNAEKLARAYLLNLMGMDLETPYDIEVLTRFNRISMDLAKAQQLGLNYRPELKVVNLGIQMSERLLDSARCGDNPTLVLSDTFENKTLGGLSGQPTTNTMTLSLTIPLSDGGASDAKVTQMKASIAELNNNKKVVEEGIRLEVKQIYLNLQEIEARLLASIEDVKTSKEGYDIALIRYENGLSTGLELDDALRSLSVAQANFVNNQFDYWIAIAQLEKATSLDWRGGTPYETQK